MNPESYLVTYTDKHVSHIFAAQEDVDSFFLKMGWQISETQPQHIFKDPINETLAFSQPLPRAMWPTKERASMRRLDFDTELIWGLVSWSLEQNPYLNYGTPEKPLFRLTEIYKALPDTVTVHLPPVRRMVNLMKTNGEMTLTTIRWKKYDVKSMWKPVDPPRHDKLAPKSFLRNLKLSLISKDHAN